jgi:hypothetical protein
MFAKGIKILLAFAAAAAALSCPSKTIAQHWTPLVHQMSFSCGGASAPMLLTDGSVLVQDYGCSDYWKLSPDKNGSYVNGTWTQIASLPADYAPLFHASAVLPDGRAIVEGGELNFFVTDYSNLGAIYDPKADTWTAIAPPAGWQSIGDAQSVVLSNGRFMLANCCTDQSALLDAKSLTWTETGSGKADINDEEGWTLLPSGKVLTIDTIDVPNSEIYNPAAGAWQSAGSTIVDLPNAREMGPQVLRADGTVLAIGSSGNNAIYNPQTGKWTAAPTFPYIPGQGELEVDDGPAALLPSGNVLGAVSPNGNQPSTFFELNGLKPIRIPNPPNSFVNPTFVYCMLLLPTGQVLLTSESNDIEIYTPAGTYNSTWRPVITYTSFLLSPGHTYKIQGYLFNGVSQGAAYGDDYQGATNYPLVRITNLRTGHVFYSRTHDHSSMAVASKNLVYTYFDVSTAQESGMSKLEVIANGVPSAPVSVLVQ